MCYQCDRMAFDYWLEQYDLAHNLIETSTDVDAAFRLLDEAKRQLILIFERKSK